MYKLQLVEEETRNEWTRMTTSTHFLFDFLQEDFHYSLRLAATTVDVGPYSPAQHFVTLPDRKIYEISRDMSRANADCSCMHWLQYSLAIIL